MSGPLIQTEAHVLAKAPHAGDQLVLTLFSPDEGLLIAMLRQPRGGKPTTATAPDLFDRLAVSLEHARGSSSGGPWFVREHRVVARHQEVGRGYEALAAASRLARAVARNPVPEESRVAVDALLTRAFGALCRAGARPDIIYYKSLYCLARDEGLPLKQSWMPSLPAHDASLAATTLALPADAPGTPDKADVERLVRRLEGWLGADHDMRLD